MKSFIYFIESKEAFKMGQDAYHKGIMKAPSKHKEFVAHINKLKNSIEKKPESDKHDPVMSKYYHKHNEPIGQADTEEHERVKKSIHHWHLGWEHAQENEQ